MHHKSLHCFQNDGLRSGCFAYACLAIYYTNEISEFKKCYVFNSYFKLS